MADFDEPRWQDVQTEPAQELVEADRHGFALRSIGIVLIGEGDGAGGCVQREDAPVADGDAVGVEG